MMMQQQDYDRPADDELDRMYRRLLEELNIPDTKRKVMMAQPMNMKWKLLSKHQRYVRVQSDPFGSYGSAVKIVNLIDQFLVQTDLVTEDHIIDLCGDIKSDVDWQLVFTELGGLGKLLHLLDFVQEHGFIQMQVDLLKCILRITHDNPHTLGVFVADQDAITIVALCLTHDSDRRSNVCVLEIFEEILDYSEIGATSLLTALEVFRLEKREMRFETLMRFLKAPQDDISINFKTACLRVINHIIDCVPEIEDRMSLRADLLYLGILRVLEDLFGMASVIGESDEMKQLVKQISRYQSRSSKDNALVLEQAPTTGSWLCDTDILMSKVVLGSKRSGCGQELIDILHALLVIPEEETYAKKLWGLLAEISQRIVTSPEEMHRMSFAQVEEIYLSRDARFRTLAGTSHIVNDLKAKNETLSRELEQLRESHKEEIAKVRSEAATKSMDTHAQVLPKQEPLNENFSKYSQMKKNGLPDGAILNAMIRDGVPSQEQVMFFGASSKAEPNQTEASSIDPKFEKYTRMQKAGLPLPVIQNAMVKDGLSQTEQDQFLGNDGESHTDAIKNDPKFAKYVRMVKAGLAIGAIANAMTKDGIVSQDQDKFFGKSDDSTTQDTMIPAKPKKNPRKPMRPLFWTKVQSSAIQDSLWNGLDDNLVDLNIDGLEAAFTNDEKQKPSNLEQKATNKDSSNDSKTIQLLEPKRLQNTGIAFARLKMSPKMLCVCIQDMDNKKLGGGIERVALLRSMIPTPEETATLLDYSGDVSKLGNIEQLFLVLSEVSNLEQRIQSWEIFLKFKLQIIENQESGQILQRACAQIKGSKAFHQTLCVVLALGNYLNGTSARGGAWGFKIDTLAKLEHLKSSDNKSNLLRYIVEELAVHNYPIMLNLPKDLAVLHEASRLSFTTFCTNCKSLERDLKTVDSLIRLIKEENASCLPKLVDFVEQGKLSLQRLDEMKTKIQESYQELLRWLGLGDDEEYQGDTVKLFELLDAFVQSFRREIPQDTDKKRRFTMSSSNRVLGKTTMLARRSTLS